MSKIQMYNMDCMEYMKTCKDNEFDLAIVDPPYGLGDKKLTNGGTWAKKYKNSAMWDKPPKQEYFNELLRVSREQIVWGGNYFNLPPSRCFIVWDKLAHMETLADCEFAWCSFDKNAKIFKHVRNTTEARIHVCQKPIKLYQWLLDKYAKPTDRILDTHLGSASSAIAAHYFGCEFVGLELDKWYFDESQKRFKDATAQTDMFGMN